MAKRRMISLDIVDTDAFLDMPSTSQLLYFHLLMRADDDGFISSPKRIMRMVGSQDDDIRILAGKKFIIPFESGVCVIKHWKMQNKIKADRYNPTTYLKEKNMLETKENKGYKLMETECIQNVSISDTQVRLGKVSIGKDRLVQQGVSEFGDSDITGVSVISDFDYFWNIYPAKKGKKVAEQKWNKLSKGDKDAIMADIPNRVENDDSWKRGFVPNPATYINQERWNDEITSKKANSKQIYAAD